MTKFLKFIFVVTILPYSAISQYSYSRISKSKFYEKGCSHSPNGKYFSFFSIDKLDTICLKEDVNIKIINSDNFNQVKVIQYPERFLCWKNDSTFITYSYKDKTINNVNLLSGKSDLLFNFNLDNLITQNLMSLNAKTYARYKFVNNTICGFEEFGRDSVKVISINANGFSLKKYKVTPKNYESIIDFDISFEDNMVFGFFQNYHGTIDFLKYDLKLGKEKEIIKKGCEQIAMNEPRIRFSDDNKSLIYKIRSLKNETDSIFIYDIKKRKQVFLDNISFNDFWILDFNYNSKATHSLIYTVMGEMFEKEVGKEKDVLDILSSIYLITTLK